jgi:hypothetical protein
MKRPLKCTPAAFVVRRWPLCSILTLAWFISLLSPRVSLAQTPLAAITVSPKPTCPQGPYFQFVTIGIAFDGTDLLVSCATTFTVTRVNPATGAVLGSYLIAGMDPP